jgi:RimJ/RimL family protein N-acetyltransferase
MTTSIFDGTWRPDPQRPGPNDPPEELHLGDGTFSSEAESPYAVPADGADHAVAGQRRFDTLAVTVIDERTVRRISKRDGVTVMDSTSVVGEGGGDRLETRHVLQPNGRTVAVVVQWRREGSPVAGAHLLSGRWRLVESDLLDHEEDTTYRIVDGVLAMRDRWGRSFAAKLDGTVAPYVGDPRFTGVAVRWLDDRTIEESDYSGDAVVLAMQWHVDDDGETMHVRFDDLHGGVMEQRGRRLPSAAQDGVPPVSAPHEIRSARLLLRPLPPLAAAALPGERGSAAALIGAALDDAWPQPDVVDLFPAVAQLPPESVSFGVWTVIEVATNSVVGDIGFVVPPDADGVVEMGYSIVPSRRRRGYAGEAAAALVGWAFEQQGVTAVVAGTDADNAASERVLEKAGFARTGEAGGEVRWRLDRPGPER